MYYTYRHSKTTQDTYILELSAVNTDKWILGVAFLLRNNAIYYIMYALDLYLLIIISYEIPRI